MYKKITHNIVEEHFDHPAVMPVSIKVKGGMPPGWGDCDLSPPGPNCPSWKLPTSTKPSSKENEEDVIKLNVPLMIRLLEWAREDASKDVALHVVAERLIDLSDEGDTLTMSDYPEIVNQEKETEKKEK